MPPKKKRKLGAEVPPLAIAAAAVARNNRHNGKQILFCRSKKMARRLKALLDRSVLFTSGVGVQALEEFSKGESDILVATSAAGRGIN
jgi:superfamily II DNA/RNA helicase